MGSGKTGLGSAFAAPLALPCLTVLVAAVVTIKDFTSGKILKLHAGQRYLAPNG